MDEQSEIVNKRMPLFSIQQRYKYYLFFVLYFPIHVRFFPSALLSECVFSHALIYRCAFFLCAFFLCAFFQCACFRSPYIICHVKSPFQASSRKNVLLEDIFA